MDAILSENLASSAEVHILHDQVQRELNDLRSATRSDINDLKIEMKNMELRIYAFMFKTIGTAVTILVGMQTLFHYLSS